MRHRKISLLAATISLLFAAAAPAQANIQIAGLAIIAHPAWHQHHQRYWWPAQDDCTIGTVERNGVLRGIPGVVCTTRLAGWHSTPPNINPADVVDPTPAAENYCPLKPGGWCHKPN